MKTRDLSSADTLADRAEHYVGRRGALIALAVVLIAAGLYLSWGWLAAIGVAPILVALAPCAAMCALGLCMKKAGGGACSSTPSSTGKDKSA